MDFPIGTIIAWSNDAIPAGWTVCDGTGATPNLVSKFIYGASVDGDVGGTGGATTHTHTNPDTSTRAAHDHGGSKSAGSGGQSNSVWVTLPSGGTNPRAGSTGHSHSLGIGIDSANAHLHTVGNTDSANHLPPYVKRVFIQRTS